MKTHKSIADRLDMLLETVRSRVARARRSSKPWARRLAGIMAGLRNFFRGHGTIRCEDPDGLSAQDAEPAPARIVCFLLSYHLVSFGIITFAQEGHNLEISPTTSSIHVD